MASKSNGARRRRRRERCVKARASNYLVVNKDGGSLLDLARFVASGSMVDKFLESSTEGEGGQGGVGPIPGDHRWVILLSILFRKIISAFGKPMRRGGLLVEFILNLISGNGGLRGLLINLVKRKVVVPQRGSKTFMSAIGHLDARLDLHIFDASSSLDEMHNVKDGDDYTQNGNRALMDLCIMASKLAYENANFVKDVISNHWKLHFVEFYDCWNDYEKEKSTQVFILCDKPKDASLVLISFRGTEPFDADDWNTDVDYSWYEIPEMGKIHMGFLEALGLGSRAQISTFQILLERGFTSKNHSSDISENYSEITIATEKIICDSDKMNAYYTVRDKLKGLLNEHKKAKFIVTGHSLGGALAILFPAVLLYHRENELMKRLLGVYTFGQPRIGDEKLEKFMEAHVCNPVPKYFRVVYCNDLVPRLPYDDKTFLYKHFGMCIYYNSFYSEQDVSEEPNRNYFGLKYMFPEHLNAFWELIRGLAMGYVYGSEYKESWSSIFLRIQGLLFPGVSAHSPANYVNSIRLGKGLPQMSPL